MPFCRWGAEQILPFGHISLCPELFGSTDTQLGMPYGLHLPTTFSATSLTAFSNDSYRSVMGVDMLLHWRTSYLLDSSS